MKRKSRIYRVGALLLVLCFISTVMISGTFAKYTSEYSGQDTALVAKWDLDVKGNNKDFKLIDDGVADLDLFNHSYDDNILTTAGAQKIIAPGVSGKFDLSVTNNSDVAAGVTFALNVSGTAEDVPIEYSLNDTLYEDVDDLAAALSALPKFENIGVDASPEAVTQTVYWRWAFERKIEGDSTINDAADTELGVVSAAAENRTEYTLTITATAEQLPPGVSSGDGGDGSGTDGDETP